MEQVIDFDQWISSYNPSEPEYVAVYDPFTGNVKSIGPRHAFINEEFQIDVDRDIAESVIEGKIKIGSCVVDLTANKVEIAEIKTIFKIDDVLHRVIQDKYSQEVNHDVIITFDKSKRTLKVELSSQLGGSNNRDKSSKRKRIIWDGSTVMDFLITDYNDPNIVYRFFSIKIDDLKGKSYTIRNIEQDIFSVYTRRLFKNYVYIEK